MCFPKPPVDRSAEIARQEEQARLGRVTQGQGKIDEAFSFFDPSFFNQYTSDFLNYYNPQVDKQFGDTKQNLRYDLARKGTLNSTPGQNRFADLIDAYTSRRDEVASNANTATNQLRSNVDAAKTDLYNLNTASADPSLAAQSAVSRAGALATPASYSPLADLFGGFVSAGANAYQNRLPPGYAEKFQPGFYSSGGSGRVVR